MQDTIRPPPEGTELNAELHHYLVKLFGVRRTQALSSALSEPGAFFFLRTNTLRTQKELLIRQLQDEDITATILFPELDAVAIPIHKTGPVPLYDKIVVADKASSENILLGSHLYRPGVKRFDRFSKGDLLTVTSPKGHMVGSGVACDDSSTIAQSKHGQVVKILDSYYDVPSISDLSTYKSGLFYSQSLPAMLVAPILAPRQ
ncbi:MAG: PUA domain-containing protein, partial [Promethearchaeota archaeon]